MAVSKQKYTLGQAVKNAQAACRKIPCAAIQNGRLKCPFCPHLAKLLRKEKEKK